MLSEATHKPEVGQKRTTRQLEWLMVAGLIYLLLLAVGFVGTGFKLAAGEQARELFAFATNPITGVVVGTVATALIQSSSTVTSIIVGLVAGGLPVGVAIPMVMGANIGTTITNTIVSLGHVRQSEEFRRAFAAATVHDFFNILNVLILLPLEVLFHPLERIAGRLALLLEFGGGPATESSGFFKTLTSAPVKALAHQMESLGKVAAGVTLVVLGVFLILAVVTFLGALLKSLMVGRARAILHAAVGRGPLTGIASGTAMTVLVQSSSTTTSLIVPLAGAGVFNLQQVYPFTLGANIGTCITALLAATGVAGENAALALQIALVHLLFNVVGTVVIYGLPFLRGIPPTLATKLANAAVERRVYAFLYVVVAFFLAPALLIFASELLR